MSERSERREETDGVTRRRFLGRIGRGAIAGGAVAKALGCSRAETPAPGAAPASATHPTAAVATTAAVALSGASHAAILAPAPTAKSDR